MNPKIDPAFKKLIPPLSPEELAQLEANLVADGCRDPLVTWDGTLIDGHNRFEICTRLGIPFQTVAMVFADESEAKVWIIRNQFGRRNLAAYTRAELALALEPLLRAKAKERQGNRNDLIQAVADKVKEGKIRPLSAGAFLEENIGQNSDKSDALPSDTKRELAKVANVSHDTIHKAKKISAEASEETKAALRSGETSINAEYKKLTVHVGHNSGENEWYTPAEFIAAAVATMGGIDIDPASSEIANKTVGAARFFSEKENGLEQKWMGRVWMNPPYAQPLISQFSTGLVERVESGEVTEAVVLVNNATETGWFQGMAAKASAICFPRSRIRFLDPNGKPGAPLQGQAFIYIGSNSKKFSKAVATFGFVLCKP